ncbi:MAG TPA: transposase [Candidatus Bipolaricaulota bacterium]|nr:transposase [Candidatus Bipolaricaulota bacterium]
MNKNQLPFWPNNEYYFITTSTFLHFPYFNTFEKKKLVLDKFEEIEERLNIKLIAYSIAINHFHYFAFLNDGLLYSKTKQLLNGGVSHQYKKTFQCKYQEMWQSTKAFVIKDEDSFWRVIGYINGNLLKHKEVSTFNELRECQFFSHIKFVKEYGEEAAKDLVYRVIDVNEDGEGNVDFNKLNQIGVKDVFRKIKGD